MASFLGLIDLYYFADRKAFPFKTALQVIGRIASVDRQFNVIRAIIGLVPDVNVDDRAHNRRLQAWLWRMPVFVSAARGMWCRDLASKISLGFRPIPGRRLRGPHQPLNAISHCLAIVYVAVPGKL